MLTVGSPRSSKERQDERAAGQKLLRRDRAAVVIGQRKGRHFGPDLDDAVEDARTAQIFRRSMHDGFAIGGNTLLEQRACGAERVFQCHAVCSVSGWRSCNVAYNGLSGSDDLGLSAIQQGMNGPA